MDLQGSLLRGDSSGESIVIAQNPNVVVGKNVEMFY